jgi:small subunit ribosomal protein S6
MPLYEHVFLTRQDASNAQVDQLTEQFKGVIQGLGGKTTKSEYWGVKSLTFRIRKNRKAHFTMFNIDAPPAAIAEMERQMSLNEDVIRFMTVRVEELEEGQSAMLRKSRDRDEDRFGFGGGFGGGGFGGGPRGGGGGRRPREEAPVVSDEGGANG